MRKFVLVLVAALFLTVPVKAGWSRAGLFGADVRAMIVDPTDPDRLFLGTSEGEVYVSNDGAKSWVNPRHAIPFPGYIVDNLAIDSKGRLWAACWGLWGGGVIAVSDDQGVTWKRRDGGLEEFSVRALVVNPCDADDIVVGGLTGVYRSKVGGAEWTKISEQENVESLAIDPRDANRIYVGTWRQAWRTDDGGASWIHIAEGMVLDTDVFSITIDSQDPDNVWVSTCGWVYRSTDRGTTWTRFRDGFNNRRVHDIDLDPTNHSIVYAGSVAGLYRSENEGKSFHLVTDESMVINAIGLTLARPDRIILGTEGDGVYVSDDRGKSFRRSSDGLYNVRVATIAPDPEKEGHLYAAVIFGNAASGIYQSEDNGQSWSRLSKTKLPEILTLNVQKNTESRFLAGTERGFFWSADGIDWTPAEPSTTPIRVERIVPYNPIRLFGATSDGVYTSKDSGKSWYRLGDLKQKTLDLTVGLMGDSKVLYALTATGVMVFDGELWFVVDDSPVKGRTIAVENRGDVETVVVAGINGAKAGHIDFNRQWHSVDTPARGETAVFPMDDSRSRLFLASDGGHNAFVSDGDNRWTELSLPFESRQVMAIAADPFEPQRFFVGTVGEGIFVYQSTGLKEHAKKAKDESAAQLLSSGTE
ncbi:MAG TPA: YCF48-related protein [Thermoanaerobaculia bacterium]|nr:YCF48-related protein [Thermoanaerobaculia bacterium]